MLKKVRKYPVSITYIVVIWVLCFMDVPETPLSNVSLIDKWVHIAMYLGTCLTIWLEYFRNHRELFPPKAMHIVRKDEQPRWVHILTWTWLAPVVMSGIIELGQAYCTGGRRSGEWLDFLANSIGCTLAAVIGIVCFWVIRARK